jgi:hypothetical protein
MAPKSAPSAAKANSKIVFKVDYSKPVGDSIFDAAEYESAFRIPRSRKPDGKGGKARGGGGVMVGWSVRVGCQG